MVESSQMCPSCRRRTLHRRQTASGSVVLALLSGAVLLVPSQGVRILGMVALAIALVALIVEPPLASRCQTCGGVTSRAWFGWLCRVAFVAMLALAAARNGVPAAP